MAIHRSGYKIDTWYIACLLCQLAAPGLKECFNAGAANKQHAGNIPSDKRVKPPEDEQVKFEKYRCP
jgi:hypothetical protein